MSNQNGFCALQVGIARHNGVASVARLFEQRIRPRGKRLKNLADLFAYKEAQVRGDLFVAAAPGVKFEPQRADALNQRQFDEVMDIFGGSVFAHLCLVCVGCELGGNCIQRGAKLRSFTLRKNSGCEEGRGVRLAGINLLGQ